MFDFRRSIIKSYSKFAAAVLATSVLVIAPVAQSAEGGHGSSGGHEEGGDKGKGPKYMGGGKGESHSKEGHAAGGGTSHASGSSGDASKDTEEKIFDAPTSHGAGKGKGPKYMGGAAGGEAGKHDDGGDAAHTH